MNKILYLGWVGFGNLGDDVCRDIFVEKMGEAARTRKREVEIKSVYAGTFTKEDLLDYNPNFVVLGGGSLLTSKNAKMLLFAQSQGIPTMIWGSGKDGKNEETWNGDFHSKLPKSAKILRRAVDNSCLVGVRGPNTKNYLKEIGCNSNKIGICGDPGLLLSIQEQSGKIMEEQGLSWMNDKVIGVNWGTTFNRLYGRDEHNIRMEMQSVISSLAKDFKIVLFPMWYKDISAMKKLVEGLDDRKNVRFIDTVYPIEELGEMLQRCLFTINFKLHANVFSAAVGTPFISLGYRAKCMDFALSLQCEDLVIRTDEARLGEQVLEKCHKLIHESKEYREKMSEKKKEYEKRLYQLLYDAVDVITKD
ncbi:polysaccharide pyruvyl transferase WcaK-like protein [Evansella vedderi]|uniref:Polysaccharide pyruvyl transferase WcaK-like protein n=1 Tax=Evansella vedderi TaxID=38282 RepID=A0ABT9ZVU3_9BACI|nr:polysaccharide pyruvyl transferase family protein [Evansella vedderi]MDQ0255359.1 polysaccharide pyruvyl transferase WcaK-like protein [Evansella vedderi]